MLNSDYLEMSNRAVREHKVKTGQSETEIYNNCCRKYEETKEHLQELMKKKEKLELEIEHLQQKQLDRKNFITEVQQRRQKG